MRKAGRLRTKRGCSSRSVNWYLLFYLILYVALKTVPSSAAQTRPAQSAPPKMNRGAMPFCAVGRGGFLVISTDKQGGIASTVAFHLWARRSTGCGENYFHPHFMEQGERGTSALHGTDGSAHRSEILAIFCCDGVSCPALYGTRVMEFDRTSWNVLRNRARLRT